MRVLYETACGYFAKAISADQEAWYLGLPDVSDNLYPEKSEENASSLSTNDRQDEMRAKGKGTRDEMVRTSVKRKWSAKDVPRTARDAVWLPEPWVDMKDSNDGLRYTIISLFQSGCEKVNLPPYSRTTFSYLTGQRDTYASVHGLFARRFEIATRVWNSATRAQQATDEGIYRRMVEQQLDVVDPDKHGTFDPSTVSRAELNNVIARCRQLKVGIWHANSTSNQVSKAQSSAGIASPLAQSSMRVIGPGDRDHMSLGWVFDIDELTKLASWSNPDERCSRNATTAKTLIPINHLLVEPATGQWYIGGCRVCLTFGYHCILEGIRPKPPTCVDTLWDLSQAEERRSRVQAVLGRLQNWTTGDTGKVLEALDTPIERSPSDLAEQG
ncbi:hypothetical protein IAU59_007623 [Kwoniella sp. CBS 9459]